MVDGVFESNMKGVSAIADNPYAYLQKIAGEIDSYDTRDKIDKVLDELDFIHELLDPSMLGSVTEITGVLMTRYRASGK
mgnify:CR=1 FL=1